MHVLYMVPKLIRMNGWRNNLPPPLYPQAFEGSITHNSRLVALKDQPLFVMTELSKL